MWRSRKRTQPLSRQTSTLTSLSPLGCWSLANFASRRLARASQLPVVALAIVGSGCLVTSSPEFSAPHLTPPYITALNPFPWQIQTVTSRNSTPPSYDTFTVRFDIVSEDLNGLGPQAALLLDFQGPESTAEQLGDLKQLPPGHLTSPCECPEMPCICSPAPRHVEWSPVTLPPRPLASGCHSITAIVSHRFVGFQPVPMIEGDIATVTWLFNLDDRLGQPTESGTCLSAGLTTGDAGASAGVAP